MQRHDLLRNGQAKAGTATSAITSFIDPVEWLEDVIYSLGRHARSLVFHNDSRRPGPR